MHTYAKLLLLVQAEAVWCQTNYKWSHDLSLSAKNGMLGWVFVCIIMCIAFKWQLLCVSAGKARRLKQAKEEAQAEVEAYRKERERQYQEHEKKVSIFHCCTFNLSFI